MDGMVVTLIIRYYYVASKPFFNITRFEKSSEVKWSLRSAHVPRPTVFHQKVSLNEAQYPAAAGDSGNHFSLEELDTKQLARSVGWFIKLRSPCSSKPSFRPWALSNLFLYVVLRVICEENAIIDIIAFYRNSTTVWLNFQFSYFKYKKNIG